MASVTTVLDAVAAAITAGVTGIRVFSYSPDSIAPPTAVVEVERIEFDSNFQRGCDEMDVRVSVFISRADDRTGLAKLRTFMGGSGVTSLKTAIESSQTLAGVVEVVHVESIDSIGARQVGEIWYYGCDVNLKIWVRGTS